MDYDFDLISVTKSEEGGFNVFPADFIKKHFGPGAMQETWTSVANDPRVVPLMREVYSEKEAEHVRRVFGHVLVETLSLRAVQAPFNYDLIEVVDRDGRAEVSTSAFLEAYAPKDEEGNLVPLRISSDVQLRVEALMRAPFSEDVVAKIKKFMGDAFVVALRTNTAAVKYAIHSMVRSRTNRTARAQAPTHARFKQHVLTGQHRLIRGRPLVITEKTLLDHLGELREKQALNLLEVRTMEGRVVNLNTFELGELSPVPLAPHPRMDSLANDIPTGIQFPRFQGDKMLSKEQVQQVVDGMAGIEGALRVDPKDGTAEVVTGDTPPPPFLEELEMEEDKEVEVVQEEEEELESPAPGIPPPPPPAGGMPRRDQGHSKKKNR